MRIVFIITGLSTGGAEMMLFKVLERLDRQRFARAAICNRFTDDALVTKTVEVLCRMG